MNAVTLDRLTNANVCLHQEVTKQAIETDTFAYKIKDSSSGSVDRSHGGAAVFLFTFIRF